MASAANPKSESSRSSDSDPAENGVAFSGAADVILATYSRGVYIAADGDLTVDFAGGLTGDGATNITFTAVKAGTVLPIKIKKIYDTGTTTSGVVLL